MSEEAAFLSHLKASPADDTARLVYADWLDERDQPARAEYLRLVAALARSERSDFKQDEREVRRILVLAHRLPVEWRAASGSRFQVVFHGCDDPAKNITIIKCIRELSQVGLADAKRMYEQPPSLLLGCVLFEQALAARDYLRAIPGVLVRVTAADPEALPLAVLYSIVAGWAIWSGRPDHEEATRRPIAAFAKFLQPAMSIPELEARERARHERVVLAENVELSYALGRIQELRELLSTTAPPNDLWIGIHHEPTALRDPESQANS